MLVLRSVRYPLQALHCSSEHRNRGIEKYACVDACYTIEAYTNLYGSGQQRIQLVLPEELIVNGDHWPPKLAEKKKGKKRDRRFPSKGDTTLQVVKTHNEVQQLRSTRSQQTQMHFKVNFYATANGMTVRLDPGKHGGAFLTYKCEGGDECRFKVTAHRTKSETDGSPAKVTRHCKLVSQNAQ
ncbi:LOW QUALITY PROTEIN: hypothetical protein PHMEG_00027454 [Phytophthora megakarya]|uniref:Uncharacterized protein n=1 Tax=Phytophthora megakarya TaxID=4795 RepID=A0A225V6V7_9STRA|nr:LOW QUALITY PROTEIN: hypothetical protein PHMEG_00027454 [Phytophthora megakarya]